ncbi:GAF domain-containing protein [Mucilaginibacter sp. HMF5004]|uniref:GAF domain-containing protein n=1 Tax=Mucilaginibacter rivuli TaxID=2857527 RepID=UPI001C5D46BB|nr:GAF domain-containing protein [Mucilaginibacter rivuli]MBW4891139.1 GAF domain-containing protein [Mucilaginibacter rivuli]
MDESLRIKSVERFTKYNLQADKELIQLLEMASEICECPIATINLLDKDTQWIKARVGIDLESTPRASTFCNQTITGDELVLIPNTLKDKRFASHPLVKGKTGIRFYAGVPLITHEGDCLGTLCVIDPKPRELNKHQQMMLKMLGKQIMTMMELKLNNDLLVQHEQEVIAERRKNNEADIKLRAFFESSVNFHVLLGMQYEVMDYNKTAYKFIKTAYHRILNRGHNFVDYIEPNFKDTFIKRATACLNGIRGYEEGYTDYPELGRIWWEASFEPATNNDKQIIGISYSIRNVTERKLYEQKIVAQNEMLRRISYIQSHEYRGPLASIMGLMNLIKLENYQATTEYLEMMDVAINRLDVKIREVVNVANQVNAMPAA